MCNLTRDGYCSILVGLASMPVCAVQKIERIADFEKRSSHRESHADTVCDLSKARKEQKRSREHQQETLLNLG